MQPVAEAGDADEHVLTEASPERESEAGLLMPSWPAGSLTTDAVPAPDLAVLPEIQATAPEIALRDSLRLLRVLRPLKWLVRSSRDDLAVLDETATAEWAAETGMWWPRTRPVRERWLDLTFVVDSSPSMTTLWRSRVTIFVALFERLGAFRTIQVRLLDTAEPDEPVLPGATTGIWARAPAEIMDSTGGARSSS